MKKIDFHIQNAPNHKFGVKIISLLAATTAILLTLACDRDSINDAYNTLPTMPPVDIEKPVQPQISEIKLDNETTTDNNFRSDSDSEVAPKHIEITKPDEMKVVVTRVIDGLTFEGSYLDSIFTVKYIGIELSKSDQVTAAQAKELNKFLVEGKEVLLIPDQLVEKSDDKYFLLRYVYLNGQSINKRILTSGFARVSDYPHTFSKRTEFQEVWEKNSNNNYLSTPNKLRQGCGTLPCRK